VKGKCEKKVPERLEGTKDTKSFLVKVYLAINSGNTFYHNINDTSEAHL